MKPRRPPAVRVGLALAGGGPLGAIYEIGALCALEEAIDGLAFARCAGYVGVSAGGFVAAGLANGISPRELCRSFIENEGPESDRFDPALLMRPAWGEYAARLATLPALAAGRPDETRAIAEWTLRTWLPDRYSPQTFYALRALYMADLIEQRLRADTAARIKAVVTATANAIVAIVAAGAVAAAR